MKDVNNNFLKEKQTLTKKEKLSKEEIRKLFREGKRIKVNDYLGIYLYNQIPYAKIGFSTKKRMGNAVYRNYEKRIVKEIFRRSKQILPNVNLFILKTGKTSTTFKHREDILLRLFRQIRHV